MNKWKYILKVPFESKAKFYKKSHGKYKFSGDVYFLLNSEGKVLKDFAILDNEGFTYRPNDDAMMKANDGKGTHFWQNKKGIRSKIFDDADVNGNYSIKKSAPEMIKKLNNISIESMPTALTMEAIISGSNSSGADTKIEATPMICVDSEFTGLRFINPFKKLRVKGKANLIIDMDILNKEEKINLEQYFKIFPDYKYTFYKYNPEAYEEFFPNGLTNEGKSSNVDIYFDKFRKNELIKERESYNKIIDVLIARYEANLYNEKNFINRLRGIQRAKLILEYNIIKETVFINKNEKVQNMDAAHLIQVWQIKKNNYEHKMISDENNGLLMPKDIHYKFDNDEDFIIDNDFNIIEKNKIINEYKINAKYINDKRKENIKLRNKLYLEK